MKEYEWRVGRSCIYKNFVHLVFVTKYRRNIFTYEMIDRLNELFAETCEQMNVKLLEFNGESDHIHLMVCYPPILAIANLVGKLKGKSSYFLRQEYWPQLKKKLWGQNLWSPSYCVVSCGGAPLQVIKSYIENQRKPPLAKHVRKSIALTKKSRLSYAKLLA